MRSSVDPSHNTRGFAEIMLLGQLFYVCFGITLSFPLQNLSISLYPFIYRQLYIISALNSVVKFAHLKNVTLGVRNLVKTTNIKVFQYRFTNTYDPKPGH